MNAVGGGVSVRRNSGGVSDRGRAAVSNRARGGRNSSGVTNRGRGGRNSGGGRPWMGTRRCLMLEKSKICQRIGDIDINMKQDLLSYLPPEIITEVFSRLPVQTILNCKCVSKRWHHLIETSEFVKLHLSKSSLVPGLALTVEVEKQSEAKIIQLANVFVDIPHNNLYFNKLSFSFTYFARIIGSVDGLLLLGKKPTSCKLELHLCNPITREYIDLHPFEYIRYGICIYGFGVSKLSGQYKVLAIFHNQTKRVSMVLPEAECKVYTIGTGSWRNIAPDPLVRYSVSHSGVFVNGCIHWFAFDLNRTLRISCFDLEIEIFTTFSPPPIRNVDIGRTIIVTANLFVLEGSLCVFDDNNDGITIWMLKESWTKELVIQKNTPVIAKISLYPFRLFKDGAILLSLNSDSIFYYSNKDKTTTSYSGGFLCTTFYSYTPSFLSLKCFTVENSLPF